MGNARIQFSPHDDPATRAAKLAQLYGELDNRIGSLASAVSTVSRVMVRADGVGGVVLEGFSGDSGYVYREPEGTLRLDTKARAAPLSGDLAALEGLAGTGIACRIAADSWALRSVVSAAGLSITNPAGIAGNIQVGATTDVVQVARLGVGVAADGAASLKLNTVPALGVAAATFLVPNAGVVSTRTAAEVLSDIGAAAAGHNHAGVYQPASSILSDVVSAAGGLDPGDAGRALVINAGGNSYALTATALQPLDTDLTSLAGLNPVGGDAEKAVVVSGANAYKLGQAIATTSAPRFARIGLGVAANANSCIYCQPSPVNGEARGYMQGNGAVTLRLGFHDGASSDRLHFLVNNVSAYNTNTGAVTQDTATYGSWVQTLIVGTTDAGSTWSIGKCTAGSVAFTTVWTLTANGNMNLTGTAYIDHFAENTAAHGIVFNHAVSTVASLTVGTTFGCNGAAAQGAYASGGALAAYAGGANGLANAADMQALHALVVAMRAALVANGIMS